MGFKPVIYSDFAIELPELNWQASVSVDMFNFSDTTPYKIFWQSEPDEISGKIEKLIRNHKFYDLILAWDNRVLSECGNARYFPTGSVWTQEADTSQKKFQISYLTSSKDMCPGHKFRLKVYDELPGKVGQIPVTKHKSPPYLPNKRDLLVPFQFSVIMENAHRPNYFTEKILDAFATKTVPVYWGCPNIEEFFNPNGVIFFGEVYDTPTRFHNIDVQDRLRKLTPETYASMSAAIEENYHKALKYCDRTGDLVRAINDSWTPKITQVHSGLPNVETK